MEKIEYTGKSPQPRFGHTICYISKGRAVLFGGATGDTGNYNITDDTFIYEISRAAWEKLETTGSQPSPRAAHSSVVIDKNQLVVLGGATGGGSLASDDLYLLQISPSEYKGVWTIVPVVGTTPGRRYGHTIAFLKPFIIVFGGNTGQETVNDLWCLNLDKPPYTWAKLNTSGEKPCPRVYHSIALCQSGSANGMLVVFGGRSHESVALNDSWGIRKHRDGKWDWIKAPYKPNGEQPTFRYQHQSLFLGSLMLIIGGRNNNVEDTLQLEIYDTETAE